MITALLVVGLAFSILAGATFLSIFVFIYACAMLTYIRQNYPGRIKNVALIYYPLAFSTFLALVIFICAIIISLIDDIFFVVVDIVSLPLLVFILCIGLIGLIFARDIVMFFKLRHKVTVYGLSLGLPPPEKMNDRLLSFSFRVLSLFSIILTLIVLISLRSNYSSVSIPVFISILLFSYILLIRSK